MLFKNRELVAAIEEAANAIIETNMPSHSLIQKTVLCGFERADLIMRILVALKIVSDFDGNCRHVLVSKEEAAEILSNL